MNHTINRQHQVAVATDYYWIPIDSQTPRGVKLQLLTVGGVAIYGHWDGRSTFYTHWAPMPKRPPVVSEPVVYDITGAEPPPPDSGFAKLGEFE